MSLSDLIAILWSKPGASEFASAALGGSMTILAQWVALKHDRSKEEARVSEARRALAWSVFFKIHYIFEVITHIRNDVERDAAKAEASGLELWQCTNHPFMTLV